MSEPVRIKITPDSKMVEIPIGKKLYKNRVIIEIMADIYTEGESEEEAGRLSEEMADDLVRSVEHQIMYADGWPGTEEIEISTWGVRNLDIEEYKEDDGDGEV